MDKLLPTARAVASARFGLIIAAIVFLAVIFWGTFAPEHRLGRVGFVRVEGFDYDAFYCGGRVTGRGDPYELEPLAACERGLVKPAAVLPVPLPPYDLAALHVQALANERRARFMWIGTLLATVIAASAFLQPVVGMPWFVLAVAVLIGNGRDELPLGQIVPFVLLGIGGAAYFLDREEIGAASGFALLTLAEPHLGLPIVAAMLVFLPKSRVALGVGIATLAAISIGAAGWSHCVEYVRRVLPFHAFAEAPFVYQFSLTYVLTVLRIPVRVALDAGTATFVGMLVIGVAAAGRLARSCGSPAFIVLVPPAFVLLGGTFIKQQQLIVAVPLCFALLRLTKGRPLAPWSFTTLFVVSFAWQPVFKMPSSDVAAFAFALVVAALTFPSVTKTKQLSYGIAVAGTYALILAIEHMRFAHHIISSAPSVAAFARAAQPDADLASYPWGIFMRTVPAYSELTVGFAIAKIVTWLGLGSMIALTLYVIRRAERPIQELPRAASERS